MLPLPVALGRAIKRLRAERGVSQEAFAAQSGLHRTYMTQLEGGKRNPSLSTIEQVAEALGLDTGELLAAAERERHARTAERQAGAVTQRRERKA
jgi:transcriptional regulator with XRE-family HTH domain